MSAFVHTLLKWPDALASLGLLLTPLVAVAYTLGTTDYQLAACTLACWTVLMEQCLAGHAPRTDGVVADLLLVCLVAVRTLQSLAASGNTTNTTYDLVWAVPLGCALFHTCFLHLTQTDDDEDADDDKRRPGSRVLGALAVAVVLAFALVRRLDLEASSNLDTTQVVLEMADAMLGIMLVRGLAVEADARDQTFQAHLVLLAIPSLDLYEWYLRLPSVALLGLLMVVAEHRRGRLLPLETVRRVLGAVGSVLASTLLWQLVVLWSVATLVMAATRVWFTTSVTFPPAIRAVSDDALMLIDDVIQPFYTFTSDPDFQTTVEIALPELAGLRGVIYKVLASAYVPLYQASHGRTSSFQPSQDALGVLGLLVPVVVGILTLLQTLPDGAAYVRSRWFWAMGFVGGALSTLLCHLLATDPYVSCWVFVFPDASLTRTYTQWGWYALAAHCAFTAACLAMFVVLSEEKHHHASTANGTGARLVTSPVRRVVDAVTQPWVVCVLLATAVIVVTMLSGTATGFDAVSPIHSVALVKFPTGRPDWIVSTNIDKLAAMASSLAAMLPSEARLAILAVALEAYALEKLGCWSCLCLDIPSLSQLRSGINDIGSAFTSAFSFLRRRRLLDHHADTTHTGRSAMVAHKRRLLSTQCSRDSCSHTQICVSDVVRDIVDQLTSLAIDGLKFVSNEMVKAIIALIPLASVIDGWMARLFEFDFYDGFSLLSRPQVSFSFQVGFINLAWAHLPTLPTTPTTLSWQLAVVAACLLAAAWGSYQLGVLMPVLRATWSAATASIAAVVVLVLATAVVLVFQMRGQLRAEGWDLVIAWNSNISLVYASALGLLLLALLLAIGADPPSQAHHTKRKPAAIELQPLLLPADGRLPESSS